PQNAQTENPPPRPSESTTILARTPAVALVMTSLPVSSTLSRESPGSSTCDDPIDRRTGGAAPTASGSGSATNPHSGMMNRFVSEPVRGSEQTVQSAASVPNEWPEENASQFLHTRYSCRTNAFPGCIATAREVHSLPAATTWLPGA